MILREYQLQCVSAVYAAMRATADNLCVVIPTGGGKTPVIATICRDAIAKWGGRVLVLAHVRELLKQASEKLNTIAPELRDKIGIYSAGLKCRDTEHSITFGGIQSVYKRACELGAFDLILIDEAHLIPMSGDGMYLSFLEDARKVNPKLRVVGFTATPFRMKSGAICGPDNVLNRICYEIGVKELIVKGYLSNLISPPGADLDTSTLSIRAGEFVADQTEALMNRDSTVEAACREIYEKTLDRHSVLIFAAGVKHANHVMETLREKFVVQVEGVFGHTKSDDRAGILDRFKNRTLKFLVNVDVLTTGFDATNIDAICLLRPTLSPGLYYQMVGRGFRLHPDKENCLVLDFGGNVLRHGPVDAIEFAKPRASGGGGDAPAKKCPECQELIAAGYASCPFCGYAFPPPEKTHDETASSESILSGEITDEEVQVMSVDWSVHKKKGAPPDAPKTMRVDYFYGVGECQSEWICVEHSGFAAHKASVWWRQRCLLPMPVKAVEAVKIAQSGGLANTRAIKIRSVSGEKYKSIIAYDLDEIPRAIEASPPSVVLPDYDLPF